MWLQLQDGEKILCNESQTLELLQTDAKELHAEIRAAQVSRLVVLSSSKTVLISFLLAKDTLKFSPRYSTRWRFPRYVYLSIRLERLAEK